MLLIPNITFIEFNFMLSKECSVFILKSSLAVMFLLVSHIVDNFIEIAFTDRK